MTAANTWSPVIEYLTSFAEYYPSIATWCSKVRKDLPSGRRSVLAFMSRSGAIDGLAITKNGVRSKLCHISVANRVRAEGVGVALMRAAAETMVQSGACRVHVTTSEEVAASYGEFFARCGFHQRGFQRGRYRFGNDELEWVTSADSLRTRLWCNVNSDSPSEATSAQVTLMRLRWISWSSEFAWEPLIRSAHVEHNLNRTRTIVGCKAPASGSLRQP